MVLFFRDQDLTIAEHVAFGRRFGELELHPFAPDLPEYPEVVARVTLTPRFPFAKAREWLTAKEWSSRRAVDLEIPPGESRFVEFLLPE